MHIRVLAGTVTLVTALLFALPDPVDGQILRRIRQAASNAAEKETASQVERLVRNAIRCAVDDALCVEKAKESGKDVVFVDDQGTIIADEKGAPVTDRDEAIARAPAPPAPGEGAWANYDFVPGDDILFYDDYSHDNVGDFPRRFDLVQGNWDVVEWEGGRYLRATSGGLIAIPLPATLPEQFTIEYPVSLRHGNAYVRIMTGRAYYGQPRGYRGTTISVEATRAGIQAVGGGPTAMSPVEHRYERDGMATLRIMADGKHMKVYLDEVRVTNAPNAVVPRSDTLFIAASSATRDSPIMIGSIRIASGGRDLYDRLDRDGRVATQGILFATNSDRIRPESTPTLEEIGTMLRNHAELRIGIEGHTDSDGDDAYNQGLSERRAAAVKDYLVHRYGVDAARLEAAGFGASRPVAGNETAEGRQTNRRVELVRL